MVLNVTRATHCSSTKEVTSAPDLIFPLVSSQKFHWLENKSNIVTNSPYIARSLMLLNLLVLQGDHLRSASLSESFSFITFLILNSLFIFILLGGEQQVV